MDKSGLGIHSKLIYRIPAAYMLMGKPQLAALYLDAELKRHKNVNTFGIAAYREYASKLKVIIQNL